MVSGRDLRRLLELRQRIRVEATALPVSRQRQILALMQDARRRRLPGPRESARELAPGEVLREIKWLIGTLALEEAEVTVHALDRMRRDRRPRATPR